MSGRDSERVVTVSRAGSACGPATAEVPVPVEMPPPSMRRQRWKSARLLRARRASGTAPEQRSPGHAGRSLRTAPCAGTRDLCVLRVCRWARDIPRPICIFHCRGAPSSGASQTFRTGVLVASATRVASGAGISAARTRRARRLARPGMPPGGRSCAAIAAAVAVQLDGTETKIPPGRKHVRVIPRPNASGSLGSSRGLASSA